MNGVIADIMLTEADIPGASVWDPLKVVHNITAVKWWLLCHKVQVSS